MSVATTDFLTDLDAEALGLPRYSDESPLQAVELLAEFRKLRQALQRPVKFERRDYGRIPLPLLLRVTPLDQTGHRLDQLALTVVGKDISPSGISFFHELPLPHRRVVVTFEHPNVGAFTLKVDLGWCQFIGAGWYISGGRLLRSLAPAK